MVIAIIWKFMKSFENAQKQHGVLVVEGSNPSVPTKPSKGFKRLSFVTMSKSIQKTIQNYLCALLNFYFLTLIIGLRLLIISYNTLIAMKTV